SETLTLEGDPEWLWPNADARGYYRFGLPLPWRQALADQGPKLLTPRERIAMAGNVPAMLLAGRLHGDEALERLGRFASDPRAESLGTAYLRDSTALDPSLVEATLQLAAIHGDSVRFETYRRRFESAAIPADRARFLAALGAFHERTLVQRALTYSLSGALR